MWQRARSADQISVRITSILDAAGDVFSEVPYEKVTMQLIATRAEFTRSNLYRYFKTREEIFLTMYGSDIETWAGRVSRVFSRSPSLPVETFVSKWTDILLEQRRLIRLSPLLALSLEKNVSQDLYREFKTNLNDQMIGIIPSLRRALPGYSEAQLIDFLLLHGALVAGGWPMSQYSEMQRAVLDTPELSRLKIDFREFYTKSIIAYLRGVTTKAA
jgi:TetR/AcrR family transcriptional regulator